MMPYCEIDKCKKVADKFYQTEDGESVAVCKKHDPESNRATRRAKVPSDPRFTKIKSRFRK